MDRFLTLSLDAQTRAFEQAGTTSGLPPTSVAKDFWVCFALRELFTLPEFGPRLTFKGGTSLSKAWGLIDRFSEDIDLTVDREALGIGADQEPTSAKSGKERDRRIDAIRTACRRAVEERISLELGARFSARLGRRWSLTIDPADDDKQTLLFAYPLPPRGRIARYLRPVVKIEFGARGEPWPADHRTVRPIAADALPDLFDAPAVQVRALRPERTFWEKVMLLHEERQRPPGRAVRPGMARHYYDVWKLIETGVAKSAAADATLFEQAASHRRVYFRRNWMNYDTLKRGRINALPAPARMETWRRDYSAMQGEMFTVAPPSFDVVLVAIGRFQSEFNTG